MRRSLNEERVSVGDRRRLFSVAEPRECRWRSSTRGARRDVRRAIAVRGYDAAFESAVEKGMYREWIRRDSQQNENDADVYSVLS